MWSCCNFDEFRIYDFETQVDAPVDTLAITDLPTRWGPLAFLFPGELKPTFGNDRVAVTRDAADALAGCFRRLARKDRSPVIPQPEAQKFILQMLVALFAEDINLLPKYFVGQLLEECHSPTVFDTFPLPQAPTVKQIDAVALAARELRRVRAEALPRLKGGLRALYRTLELPGANPLKDAHANLDTAVLAAHGFSTKKDLLASFSHSTRKSPRTLSKVYP
ncbi:MAG: hypothetical protein QOF48_3255 [Verrucomicrobiota bacterium]|jgi:hypothetical protein